MVFEVPTATEVMDHIAVAIKARLDQIRADSQIYIELDLGRSAAKKANFEGESAYEKDTKELREKRKINIAAVQELLGLDSKKDPKISKKIEEQLQHLIALSEGIEAGLFSVDSKDVLEQAERTKQQILGLRKLSTRLI
ncbi:MAG: hypothetical protein M1514_03345 [Patescibacteria group bacterium]|nr:hypothetical protein [Patescibacteria group bacterium]